MKAIYALFSLIIIVASSADTLATMWIGASDGSRDGNGTLEHPYDLKTIFGSGGGINPKKIQPGDTIAIRGGTINDSYWVQLYGTENAPIVVMPYQQEKVIFDTNFPRKVKNELTCAIKLSGDYIIFRDFTFTSTIQHRVSEGTTGKSMGINTRSGMYLYATNSKVINCVFHNLTSNGILWLAQSNNTLLYGCLFMMNGWDGSDRGHGHAIYIRNNNVSKPKVIANNVFHNSMGHQINGYGEIEGFIVKNNVAFEGGNLSKHGAERNIFFGGSGRSKTIDGLVITDNITYHRGEGRGFEVGYIEENKKSVVIKNNIILGGRLLVVKEGFENLEVADNQLKMTDLVKVQPNQYDHKKATITVLNPEEKPTINVDLSAVLPKNTRFKLIDYQNYYGKPVLEGIYKGGTITLPLHLKEILEPIGDVNVKPTHTGPEFNSFMLLAEQDLYPPS